MTQVAEFILCEDIREELNGKVSLMGLYRDQIAFLDGGSNVWPRALRLAVYVRINEVPPENLRLTLRIEHEGTTLFEYPGLFVQQPESPKTELNVNANLGLNIPGYGNLLARVTVENELGERLLEKERPLAIVPQTALRASAPTGPNG